MNKELHMTLAKLINLFDFAGNCKLIDIYRFLKFQANVIL